jgi:hypothetical protein
MVSNEGHVCRSCKLTGAGYYCNQCGQPFKTKRITLSGLVHDVLHLFTHLDKGFGYTLKQLVVAPGHMQRRFIEGERSKFQKPFSMFFVCATIAGLGRYWMLKTLLKYYHSGNVSEANFFHEYMVLLHVALLPLFALIAFVFFYKSKYNYAEIGVFMLYTVSVFFIVATLITSLKFIWPGLDTAVIELPVFVVYNSITFINFFHDLPRWKVLLKSLVILGAMFYLIQVAEDLVVATI